jgi:hypothetical protein
MDTQERFVTREELRELIKEELGIPIGKSTFEKICTDGQGPAPEAIWGPGEGRYLYLPSKGLAWARARLRRPVMRKSRSPGRPSAAA